MRAIELLEKRSQRTVAEPQIVESERLDAIDAMEAKRRKVEAELYRYKEFEDTDSGRYSAIQLLELRREQANRKADRNIQERYVSHKTHNISFF